MRDHCDKYLAPIRAEISSKEKLVKTYMERIESISIANNIDAEILENNLAEMTRLYKEKQELEAKLQYLRRKELILSNPTFILLIGKQEGNVVTDSFPMLSQIESEARLTIDDEIKKVVNNQNLILNKGEYVAIAVRRILYKLQSVKMSDLLNDNNYYVSSKAFSYDGKKLQIHP